MTTREQQIAALEKDWAENPRWKNVKRGYSAADVVRLRGSLQPECTLAQRGAQVLWDKVNGSAKKGYAICTGYRRTIKRNGCRSRHPFYLQIQL